MAVLIIESNFKHAQALSELVRAQGCTPMTVSDTPQAAGVLAKEKVELVLATMNGNAHSLIELLRTNYSKPSPVPVIVMSENASVDDATEMMKLGAHDFWVKPVDRERLAKTISMIAQESAPSQGHQNKTSRRIVTQNARMVQLKALAERIAPSQATVLILGESGTGKEMFARYIHELSKRRNKPFIAVNCAALPEGLMESELFGHERGAFTGAVKAKEGKFELANGGTLLLDEITEIPPHLQAKLLRVLQENEIDRVGGRFPIPVDVRVIATTNANINQEVAHGRFRKDLYYRLNVIPIRIPPLRERIDDIPILVSYFIEKYSLIHRCQVNDISAQCLSLLKRHDWPGNVRELENVIQRAVLLSNGKELTPECLLFDGKEEDDPKSNDIELMSISQMEKLLIDKALETVDGNRTKAAEILGISVRTLRNKLNEYRQQSVFDA